MIQKGIFGNEPCFKERFVPDYEKLSVLVESFKNQGLKVVLTQGSFDWLHIGHYLYLEMAKSYGDVLIVGVDSDQKIKERKGPDRPVIGQDERLNTLVYNRSVDVITLKESDHPHLHLLKTVRPDILIISKSTKKRTEEELAELGEYSGEVVQLEPQATTSTSARIRRTHMQGANKLAKLLLGRLETEIPRIVEESMRVFEEENGR